MSIETARPGAERSAHAHLFGLALGGHLLGAALLWWAVSAPDRSVVHNDDFVRWVWLAGMLGAVLAAAVGGSQRSWRSTARAGLGVGAALVLELVMFAAWIISHSQ